MKKNQDPIALEDRPDLAERLPKGGFRMRKPINGGNTFIVLEDRPDLAERLPEGGFRMRKPFGQLLPLPTPRD